MIYSSNFIFLLAQLLLVQSVDPNLNYFYQKLLTTTNRSKFLQTSPFPTKGRPPVLYPHAFHEQFYSKIQTTTPIATIYTVRPSRRRSAYDVNDNPRFADWYTTKPSRVYYESEVSCNSYNVRQCEKSKFRQIDYCCPNDEYCGVRGGCDKWPTIFLIMCSISVVACVFGCLLVHCICSILCADPVQSNNPVINTRSTRQLLETSTEPFDISIYLAANRQNMDNSNLRCSETQSLIRDTSLGNSIGLIEQQRLQNDNNGMRRTSTTLSSPPAYDDIVQQSSTTTTMEQQPSLPPSYDEFILGNRGT